jgi:hypothetical protein
MPSARRAAPLLIAGGALLGLVLLLFLLARTGPEDERGRAGPDPGAGTAEAPPPAPAPALPTPTRDPGTDVLPLPSPEALDAAPVAITRWSDEREVALLLSVRHAEGAPAAGVGLVLARANRVLSAARTDADGRARLDGVVGEADLWLGGVLPAPHREILGSAGGQLEIVLPAGAFVDGRVTVDGRPPEQPVPLALGSLSMERSAGSERSAGNEPMQAWVPQAGQPTVPWPVRAALRVVVPGLGSSRLENAQLTGPGGSFRFSGLPAGWNASFLIPEAYRFEADQVGATRPTAIAPASGVLVPLSAVARVTGRVVGPGGEPAVPGAHVRFTLSSGASTVVETLEAGADGRFAIPLTRVPVTLLQLRLRDPDWTASLERTFTEVDAAWGAELGDLELLPVRRVAFVARDVDGRPVPGAVAVADDQSGAKSEPSNAQGEGELRGLAAETHAMVLWAHRYRPTEVALPEDLTRPLTVVLARAASLDVLVLMPDGSPARNVLVHVATEQALFERPEHLQAGGVSVLPEATAFAVGTSRPAGASFRSDTDSLTVVVGSMSFAPDGDGRVSLSALRADTPFTLSVQDASGAVVWGPQTLRVAQGELREQRVELPYDAVDLAVRVRDGAGRPVVGAKVTVTAGADASGTGAPGTVTGGKTRASGPDGLARFPDLYAERVQISVEHPEHAIAVLSDVVLPPDGAPLDVTLLPGLALTVRLRDAAGADVAADRVWAVIGQHTVSRDETPAVGNDLPAGALFGSYWTLANLPSQPVRLRARLGYRVVEREHDPRAGGVTIVVE